MPDPDELRQFTIDRVGQLMQEVEDFAGHDPSLIADAHWLQLTDVVRRGVPRWEERNDTEAWREQRLHRVVEGVLFALEEHRDGRETPGSLRSRVGWEAARHAGSLVGRLGGSRRRRR